MPGPKGTGQRWRDAQHGCFLPVFPTTHRLWVDRRQPLLRRAKDHDPLGMGMRMRGDMDHHHHQRQRPSPPRARRQSAPSSQAPDRGRDLSSGTADRINAPGQARRGFPGCSHKQATPRSIRCLASVEPSSSASRLLQRQSIPALGSTFSSGQPCGRRDIAPSCLLCLGPWQRFWCFSPSRSPIRTGDTSTASFPASPPSTVHALTDTPPPTTLQQSRHAHPQTPGPFGSPWCPPEPTTTPGPLGRRCRQVLTGTTQRYPRTTKGTVNPRPHLRFPGPAAVSSTP